MQEVEIKLRFLTPCLGNKREAERSLMLKDKAGRVIFLQSWWRAGLLYASEALSVPGKLVRTIQWSPIVDGIVKLYKRWWRPEEYTVHEAFLEGDEIGLIAMLPRGLTIEKFQALLSTAGRFVGISPYGWKEDFGRFEVVEVRRRGHNHQRSKPDSDPSGDRLLEGVPDIHQEEGGNGQLSKAGRVHELPAVQGGGDRIRRKGAAVPDGSDRQGDSSSKTEEDRVELRRSPSKNPARS